MHFASQYIGLPWSLGATGPDSFDCWGLVRQVQRAHYGREMPALAVGAELHELRTPEQWLVLRNLLAHTPWRRVETAADGDVIVCKNRQGPHVGVALSIDGRIGVLHAIGGVGNPGSVVFTPRLSEICELGFVKPDAWRYTP